jgi:hypothetical protein
MLLPGDHRIDIVAQHHPRVTGARGRISVLAPMCWSRDAPSLRFMARQQVGEIRINPRTVRIGHQVYPLANISRVQTVQVTWAGKRATSYPAKKLAVWVVLYAVVAGVILVGVPALDVGDDEMTTQLLIGASALFGLRIGYLLLLLIYRLLRSKHYALLLETAGTQYAALSGSDQGELHRIEREIVGAIERPPTQERVVHLHGDLVVGDQFKQTGADSRMTVAN